MGTFGPLFSKVFTLHITIMKHRNGIAFTSTSGSYHPLDIEETIRSARRAEVRELLRREALLETSDDARDDF